MPDVEYYKQYDVPVLLPNVDTSMWKMPPLNNYEPPIEKSVTNINLNFGPQHPAAHGVLRLVLELDGEVCVLFHKANYFSKTLILIE